MILTVRDRNLLSDIQTFGLLTTRMIAARHFPKVAMTTILRRLRILESNDYIQRISGLERGQHAWSLTKFSAVQIVKRPSKIHYPRFILDHDLKLVDLRLRLEGSGITQSWRPEHEIRARVAAKHGLRTIADRIIPDALIGIETNGFRETVAIELELSIKNQKRYRSILREYASKDKIWGVWYVVHSPTIGKQIMKAAKHEIYISRGLHIFWSVFDEVMKDPLNAPIYSLTHTRKLSELWKPAPAHTPTQGMSRQVG